MSLQVLAYNLKRVMNILGVEGLLRALYALFVALFSLRGALTARYTEQIVRTETAVYNW